MSRNTVGCRLPSPLVPRFPFEKLASQHSNLTLVRINRDYPEKQAAVPSFIPFREDIGRILSDITR